MTLQNPLPTGSTPDEAPAASWEIRVEVPFKPELTTQRMDELRELIYAATEVAVRTALGANGFEPHDIEVQSLTGLGSETPIFPMISGEMEFTCIPDIEEMVERLCEGTDLEEPAYDVTGRAYELGVAIEFHRASKYDGRRRAIAPSARAVRQSDTATKPVLTPMIYAAFKEPVTVKLLRRAVRDAELATSLRAVSRETGIAPPTLRQFVDGSTPRAETRDKLVEWYIGRARVDRRTAYNLLRLLFKNLPARSLKAGADEVIQVVAARYSAANLPAPSWTRTLRGRVEVPL